MIVKRLEVCSGFDVIARLDNMDATWSVFVEKSNYTSAA